MAQFLSISIFYAQNHLTTLLLKGIRPFVKENRNNISWYAVFFSGQKGSHLTLMIEPKTESEKLRGLLESFLLEFIRLYPSNDTGKNNSIPQLFMDYPNNTLRINNSPNENFLTLDKIAHRIHAVLTRLLFRAFNKTGIDDSKILDFLIYLQLGLLIILLTAIEETKKRSTLMQLNHQLSLKIKKHHNFRSGFDPLIFDLVLKQNFHVINEIIYEIRTDSACQSDFWLKYWIRYCQYELSKGNPVDKFITIIDCANWQMGFSGSPLNYFLGKHLLTLL